MPLRRREWRGTNAIGGAIGYQLVFWKQTNDRDMLPSAVCQSLMDERAVDGLATLPIESILSDLLAALPGSVRESEGGFEWIDWDSEDGQSSIQIGWSDVHVNADCRNVEYDVVNRVIEVLARVDCPLYYPQVDQRFDAAAT